MLLTPDGIDWRVAYGSPVGGELKDLTAQGGHFRALLAGPTTRPGEDGESLALWASADGTDWALEETQPTLPVDGMRILQADMAVSGDRLIVTASGDAGGELASIVLLSPPLP